jgi:hypothetical protein
MATESFYRLHNLLVAADASLAGSFWPVWRWKLDPYKCVYSDKTPDLYLKSAKGWEPPGLWQKKVRRDAGLFYMDTFSNSCGEILFEYGRKTTGERFVLLWMSADCREIRLLSDCSDTAGALPLELLGQLMPQVMLKHGIITFHGVLMEYERHGIILSASSGIGKTTHARLWRDTKDALIINGDRAVCSLENNRWVGYGLPWSGTSGEQINRSVPVKVFTAIRQSSENKAERLEGLEAFEALLPNILYPAWDEEMTGRALDHLEQFLADVPVFRLHCRPDTDAVEVLYQALLENGIL